MNKQITRVEKDTKGRIHRHRAPGPLPVRLNRCGMAAALLLALGTFTPVSEADSTTPTPPRQQGGFWSAQFENDLFGSGDDQFYSNGMEFSYLSLEDPSGWITGVSRLLPFFHTGDVGAVQYSIGQKIYTPKDTETRTLIEDDRPYAGWLYGSAELLSRYVNEPNYKVGNILGITLGIVGPSSQAGDTQNGWHDLIDIEKTHGWDNELRDELGIVLTYTRRWQHFRQLGGGLEFETAPHVVGALGNVYTYAGAGGLLRLGSGLRNDIAPPNIRPGFPGVSYLRPSTRPSWYFFAGAEGRAVARNIFLDGNTFKDSHSVDKKPLVMDLQFGFAFHINQIRISLSNVWRSHEFEEQDKHAQFGSINISFFLPE